jgi:hypothetical protein
LSRPIIKIKPSCFHFYTETRFRHRIIFLYTRSSLLVEELPR